jgi:hypothetical protein
MYLFAASQHIHSEPSNNLLVGTRHCDEIFIAKKAHYEESYMYNYNEKLEKGENLICYSAI